MIDPISPGAGYEAALQAVRAFFAPDGPLAAVLGPGHELRAQQSAMAEAVLRALYHDDVLLVEAGTGTGKTLAYLVPAVFWPGRRLVVCTHTRNLQDQLAAKDVPLVERALGRSIGAVVMKGLANYLCLRRWTARAEAGERGEPRIEALAEWARETETGDRAEIPWLSDADPLWREISSGSEVRIGGRCPFFQRCFVTRLRRRASEANLVLANHHLFFADLALPADASGSVLPPWDGVVFDEAHALEDAAAGFFGVRITGRRVELFRGDVTRRVESLLAGHGALDGAMREGVLGDLDGALAALGDHLSALDRGAGREDGDAGIRRVPLRDAVARREVVDRYHEADERLDRLEGRLRQAGFADEELAVLGHRCAQLRADLAALMEGDDENHVAWLERAGSGGEGGDRTDDAGGEAPPVRKGRRRRRKGVPAGVTAGRTPVSVASILQDLLYERGVPVVLTSATLADHRGFGFVRSRLGLEDRGEELRLDSPFDFARQALLVVPDDVPEPREPGFRDALFEWTTTLLGVTGGGALLLYTSYRNLDYMARRLREEAGFGDLLVQGEAPRGVLLDRLRDAGDGVLLATASFWHGVDVAGEALRLVVIDKLPFEVPKDPVVAARIDRIRREGREPFAELQVPAAALALRQGFGRLIRTRRDRGIVAVLDPRLRRRGYGKAFLSALPPCPRAATPDEVRAWWSGAVPVGPPAGTPDGGSESSR
jgi:ATP-dependent DNA helicase DinG